jgi:ABC-2 type transport system permease protein
MTTTTTPAASAAAARPVIPHVGLPGLRLVRSEIRKITTTNAWWLFGIASVLITGLFTWVNTARASSELAEARDTSQALQLPEGIPPAEAARAQAQFAAAHDVHQVAINSAASIFTSGQFFGLVLVMLLGVLVITNEFQYQTATATFLTTPHRTRVVFGKLAAAIGLATLFWALSQAISLTVGSIFFSNIDLASPIGEWPVQRAMLFNLLAYLLWAIFGFGLGTLIRSQIGSVVVGMVVYLGGFLGGIVVFALIREFLIHKDGVLTAAVVMPSIASQIMVSPEKVYEQAAVWWVGALVLFGWSVLFGLIGILLTRRRDIA